jgi:cell division protein FtsB
VRKSNAQEQKLQEQKLQEPKSFWSRYARTILGLALFLIAIHDVFGSHGLLAMRRTQEQVQELRGEIDRLNQENGDLNKQVQALRADPKAVERIAREEMGLARPGEMIFKIPEQSQDSHGAPSKR